MESDSKPDLLVSTVVAPPMLGTYAHDALWRLSESTLSFLHGFLPSLSRGIPGPNLPTAYLTDLFHIVQAGSTSSRPHASAQASLFLLLCGSQPLPSRIFSHSEIQTYSLPLHPSKEQSLCPQTHYTIAHVAQGK